MRPLITASSLGWCYLLHLSRPLGNLTNPRAQASHYSGWAEDPIGDGAGLEQRVAEHLAGRGAKLTRAAIAQGIEITLVAAWRAPLSFEKRLKRRKEAPRLCPICCAARGRKVRQVIVVEQLALPLEIECDFESAPLVPSRADWYEVSTLRRWRAAAPALAPLPDDWDDGLL